MEQVRERLGLSQDQLTRSLNTADQTAQRPDSRGKTGRISNNAQDLRELLSRMDDYVLASEEKKWLLSRLDATGERSPRELIAEGQARDRNQGLIFEREMRVVRDQNVIPLSIRTALRHGKYSRKSGSKVCAVILLNRRSSQRRERVAGTRCKSLVTVGRGCPGRVCSRRLLLCLSLNGPSLSLCGCDACAC
jgi:hypothetical protein